MLRAILWQMAFGEREKLIREEERKGRLRR
jgi:hypothetical protein